MDKHAVNVLEFEKIKGQLKEHITSKLTETFIENIKPATDPDYITARQEEVTQAKKILIREDEPPLAGIRDIRSYLKKVDKEIVLAGQELLAILNTLITGHRLNNYFLSLEDEDDEYYRIIKIATSIGRFKKLEKSIKSALDNQGNVKDSASSKLREIRTEMRRISDGVKDKLNAMINSNRYQKYIQEQVVTIREERYVIPIKREYQQKFPGIVHDQSASGQTVFIEPMPIVKLNNKLRQLMSQEEQEVYRILQELSFKVKAKLKEIKDTVQVLSILDFIFAKARYSLELDAVEPLLSQEGNIDLTKARHPLLAEDVVPIDIHLGKEFNTLVITGPNTGGKTVTLKTVGLLTLMAQSGLHIPALSGSKIGVFNQIYADIGDEQSIEQNLSTFSSHMKQITKIIDQVEDDSLVLLDELGAGTDPVEGAALAMSLLDYLHQKNSKTVATTHYSELKTYAYNNQGVENASVEFDVETLQPTYKLQMGLPGRSNAFQIASRLGLKDEVIEKASQFLNQEDARLDQVIKEIESDKKEYHDKREEAEEKRQQVDQLKEEYEIKLKKLEERKEKELKEAYREANKVIKRAQQQAKGIIAELKEKQRLSDREIEAAKSKLREGRKAVKEKANQLVEEAKQARQIPELRIGDQVKVRNLNKEGEVIELHSDKKEAVVQAGIMKLTVDLRELEKTEGSKEKNQKKTNVNNIKAAKSRKISPKLDLRGLRAVEAKNKLDKYLDDAMLTNLNQAEIIHGKGTGTLREVVHETLERYPGVREYRLGRPKEGGAGITIVNF
ncbi:endonuclease MutS2 [Natroniella acetigena]|uniref:endonuclease MutS2 n=1 Tax=Natroniella acetigena TaxID=52004 RepID=UPI00200AF914|nr:endonuclease MutS2 [Natroniella acetigena]MCK8828343.1 endonuclease MutS2 [Natroniella acetigena]